MLLHSLLAQLEDAINAVEPRVLAEHNAGLSQDDLKAVFAREGLTLPADLCALYSWRNGGARGILGSYAELFPLPAEPRSNNPNRFTLIDGSHYIRETMREFYEEWPEFAVLDVDAREFFFLFDTFGDGSYLIAHWTKDAQRSAVWNHDPGDIPSFFPEFDDVETMVRTALACWQNGVFVPVQNGSAWILDTNWDIYDAIKQQHNAGK